LLASRRAQPGSGGIWKWLSERNSFGCEGVFARGCLWRRLPEAAIHPCSRCGSSVGDAFRYCPWCAAPQRLKLVEFFRTRETDAALRVSRYLHDELDERHVRFSIWSSSPDQARVDAAVSLEDDEADRLGRFLLDTSSPARRHGLRELVDRVASIRF